MSPSVKRRKTTMESTDDHMKEYEAHGILVAEHFFPSMEVPVTYDNYRHWPDLCPQTGRAAKMFLKCKQKQPLFQLLKPEDTPTTLALTLCMQPLYRTVSNAPYVLDLDQRCLIADAGCVIFGHHGMRLMMEVIMCVRADFQKYSDFLDRVSVEADAVDEILLRDSWSRHGTGIEVEWSEQCLAVLGSCDRLLRRLRSSDYRVCALASDLHGTAHVEERNGVLYSLQLTDHGYWELISNDGRNKVVPFQAFGAFG